MKAIFLIISFLSLNTAFSIETKWELLFEEDGIEVFKGEVPGSQLVALKGVANINASLASTMSVLYDVENGYKWMHKVHSLESVEVYSKTKRIVYNQTNAPWPLSNRDFVYWAEMTKNKANDTITLHLKNTSHPKVPERKGVVRAFMGDSRYILKQVALNQTNFIVEIFIDPKGSVPKWIVNLFQEKWPSRTIKGIQKRVMDEDFTPHPDILDFIHKKI